MKRISLFLIMIVFVVALFAGCIPVVPSDVKDIEVRVTAFKQYVYCGAKDDVKTYTILNGEKFKCGPWCPPQCPACDSCCPECEVCEECPDCDSCCDCEECETCQECEICEECPTCPPCCCALELGDLVVDFEMKNIGNVDVCVVDMICFVINFEDGTETERCVDVGDNLLIGECKDKWVEIDLPNPIKRVVFVEVKNYEFH